MFEPLKFYCTYIQTLQAVPLYIQSRNADFIFCTICNISSLSIRHFTILIRFLIDWLIKIKKCQIEAWLTSIYLSSVSVILNVKRYHGFCLKDSVLIHAFSLQLLSVPLNSFFDLYYIPPLSLSQITIINRPMTHIKIL